MTGAIDAFEALWADFEAYGVASSVRSTPAKKREVFKAAVANDPIAQALEVRGLILGIAPEGRIDITCPWVAEHTTEGAESATSYYPAHTGGFAHGGFKCLHAHCDGRTVRDLRNVLGLNDATDDFQDISGEVAPKRERFQREKAHAFAQGYNHVIQWIVRYLVPDAPLVVVFGRSKSGKTHSVLDVVAHAVLGVDWRGLPTVRVLVTYASLEGQSGFRKRLAAFERHHGCVLEGMDIITEAPNLLVDKDVASLIDSLIKETPPKILVLDTLARTHTGNENSGEDMGKVLKACERVRAEVGCNIVLVHHTGKDEAKGMRGWSGLYAAADAVLEVTSDASGNRNLFVEKQKDGEDGQNYPFRLVSVPLGTNDEGEPVSSVVCEQLGVGEPVLIGRQKKPSAAGRGKHQQHAIEALRELQLAEEGWVAYEDLIDATVQKAPAGVGRDKRKQRAQEAVAALIAARVMENDGDLVRFSGVEA